MYDLEGKSVIITGGSQGIGRVAALAFAKEKARLVLADIDEDAGAETVEEVKQAGAQDVFFLKTDVSSPEDTQKLAEETRARFGRIDVACNNAGIMHKAARIPDLDPEDFERTLMINVKGVFLCMRAQIPIMLENGGGSIINTASLLGLRAVTDYAGYVASKHAVMGLTKAAALEFGSKGIRVNAVSPGLTNTDMATEGLLDADDEEAQQKAYEESVAEHPIGRLAEPEDIAEGMLWLASDRSAFVLGTSLTIDGGWAAK